MTDTPYCSFSCDSPATTERFLDFVGDNPVVELVCAEHAWSADNE